MCESSAAPTPPKRLRISELNPHLLCALCGGYLIDATTITECLHSFCKTCILRYLETSTYCPICEVLIHKTRPWQNIRLDHSLQNAVYKWFPDSSKNAHTLNKGQNDRFFSMQIEHHHPAGQIILHPISPGEMRRRREFYEQSNLHDKRGRSSSRPHDVLGDRIIFSQDEEFSVSIEFSPDGKPVAKVTNTPEKRYQSQIDKRYLKCPAGLRIEHLKKFIRSKFSVPVFIEIDLFHESEPLCDTCSLMDVAYIYSWKRDCVMQLFYSFYENPSRKRKMETVTNIAEKVSKKSKVKEENKSRSDKHFEGKKPKKTKEKSKDMKQGRISGKNTVCDKDAADLIRTSASVDDVVCGIERANPASDHQILCPTSTGNSLSVSPSDISAIFGSLCSNSVMMKGNSFQESHSVLPKTKQHTSPDYSTAALSSRVGKGRTKISKSGADSKTPESLIGSSDIKHIKQTNNETASDTRGTQPKISKNSQPRKSETGVYVKYTKLPKSKAHSELVDVKLKESERAPGMRRKEHQPGKEVSELKNKKVQNSHQLSVKDKNFHIEDVIPVFKDKVLQTGEMVSKVSDNRVKSVETISQVKDKKLKSDEAISVVAMRTLSGLGDKKLQGETTVHKLKDKKICNNETASNMTGSKSSCMKALSEVKDKNLQNSMTASDLQDEKFNSGEAASEIEDKTPQIPRTFAKIDNKTPNETPDFKVMTLHSSKIMSSMKGKRSSTSDILSAMLNKRLQEYEINQTSKSNFNEKINFFGTFPRVDAISDLLPKSGQCNFPTIDRASTESENKCSTKPHVQAQVPKPPDGLTDRHQNLNPESKASPGCQLQQSAESFRSNCDIAGKQLESGSKSCDLITLGTAVNIQESTHIEIQQTVPNRRGILECGNLAAPDTKRIVKVAKTSKPAIQVPDNQQNSHVTKQNKTRQETGALCPVGSTKKSAEERVSNDKQNGVDTKQTPTVATSSALNLDVATALSLCPSITNTGGAQAGQTREPELAESSSVEVVAVIDEDKLMGKVSEEIITDNKISRRCVDQDGVVPGVGSLKVESQKPQQLPAFQKQLLDAISETSVELPVSVSSASKTTLDAPSGSSVSNDMVHLDSSKQTLHSVAVVSTCFSSLPSPYKLLKTVETTFSCHSPVTHACASSSLTCSYPSRADVIVGSAPSEVSTQNVAVGPAPSEVSTQNVAVGPAPSEVSTQNVAVGPAPSEVSTQNVAVGPAPSEVSTQNVAVRPAPSEVSTQNVAVGPAPSEVSTQNVAVGPAPSEVSTQNVAVGPAPSEVSTQNVAVGPAPCKISAHISASDPLPAATSASTKTSCDVVLSPSSPTASVSSSRMTTTSAATWTAPTVTQVSSLSASSLTLETENNSISSVREKEVNSSSLNSTRAPDSTTSSSDSQFATSLPVSNSQVRSPNTSATSSRTSPVAASLSASDTISAPMHSINVVNTFLNIPPVEVPISRQVRTKSHLVASKVSSPEPTLPKESFKLDNFLFDTKSSDKESSNLSSCHGTKESSSSTDAADMSPLQAKIKSRTAACDLISEETSKSMEARVMAVHHLPKAISQTFKPYSVARSASVSSAPHPRCSSFIQTTKISTLIPKSTSLSTKAGTFSKSFSPSATINNVHLCQSVLPTSVSPRFPELDVAAVASRNLGCERTVLRKTPIVSTSSHQSSSQPASASRHKLTASGKHNSKYGDSRTKRNSKHKIVPPLSIPKSCLLSTTTLKLQRSPGSSDHYIFAPVGHSEPAGQSNGERSKSKDGKHHGARTSALLNVASKDSLHLGRRQRVPTIKISDINRNPIIVESGQNKVGVASSYHYPPYRTYNHGRPKSCTSEVVPARTQSRGGSDSSSPTGSSDRSPARDSRRPSDSEIFLSQHWHGYSTADLLFNGFKLTTYPKFPDLHYDTDAMPLDYSQSSSKS